MRLRALKSLALAIPLVLIFSASALADTCNDFATFTCAGNSNVARLGGGTASGQAVGFVFTGSPFTVFTTNSKAAGDVIIIPAAAGSLSGASLNGSSFVSLSSFPEGGAINAINSSLSALGFGNASSFGYVDLKTALSAGGSVTVNASGLPAGTALYAVLLNANGQIVFITPISAGVSDRAGVPTER